MQDAKLVLELFGMLLDAPVQHRTLEAVFVPTLPRMMTKLLQLTSKAQVCSGVMKEQGYGSLIQAAWRMCMQ